MKFIITVLTCFSFLCFFSAKAQPLAGNGCMTKTSPSRVHQIVVASYGGLPTYEGSLSQRYSEWTVQYDITAYPCFKWNQTASNGCYIKNGSSYTLGNYGNFTGTSGTNCPIDDYIFPFVGIVAGLSFYQIRRRHLFC